MHKYKQKQLLQSRSSSQTPYPNLSYPITSRHITLSLQVIWHMRTADLSMQNKDFCFQLAETSSSCSFFLRHQHATAYSFQSRSTRETESWCLFDLGRLNKRNKLQNSSYHCFIAILAIILDHLPLKFISGFPNVPSKQRVEICGTWAGHQGNLRKCSHGNTTTSKSMEILENTTTVTV